MNNFTTMTSITTEHIFLIGIIAIQFIYICRLLKKNNTVISSVSSAQNPEAKYKDLFDNANDAIFMLDKDQNYIDVNQKAVELFGYSREEFLQLNVKNVIPSAQAFKSKDEFKRLHEIGKYERFEGKQRTKDGRWLDIEVNSSIIKDNGKVVGSRDIVRDISNRKKVEEERESIIADLQKSIEEIKSLKGILPLCSFCKQIRDAKGDWRQVDEYIHNHSEADISHTVCPDCMKIHYPDVL